ncbi:MAG: DUF2207 domain-containing protein [Patescibacteria group bacterium]|jgi:uncharacterized membrane protein YgcG
MKKFFCLVFLVSLAAFFPFSAKAYERITDFSSDIAVNRDGTLTVTETIKAVAEHNKINHGIYRDLIVKYRGPDNDHYYQAGVKILSVKRDGVFEPYHTEITGADLRIYIGDSDKLVPLGEPTYELTYQVSGLMRYSEKADELYWNVTGNNWEFSIEKAHAQVTLPWTQKDYATVFSYSSLYTGASGSRDHDGYFDEIGGKFFYRANSVLYPGEGLTIVLGWPQGRIAKLLPTLKEVDFLTKFLNSLNQQSRINILITMSLLVLIYFAVIWLWRGRGPRPGTIIPQYDPPVGLSPGDIAHVASLGLNFNNTLGALIISLAIKGKIKITKKNGFFSAVRWELDRLNEETAGLSEDEKLLVINLFRRGDKLKLPDSSSSLSMFIRWTFRPFFHKKWHKVAYVNNSVWLFLGVMLSILLLMFFWSLGFGLLALASLPFAFLAIFFIAFASSLVRVLVKGDFNFTVVIYLIAIIITSIIAWVVLRPFFLRIAELPSSFWLDLFFTYWYSLLLLAVLVVNFLAFRFLRRPTPEGRKLLDEIEGFKLFLMTTEKDRLEFFHPIKQIPEVFEKYFPYAIALGVADKWAARFDNLFRETDGQAAYAPIWYGGSLSGIGGIGGISSIGSSLGSSLGSSGAGGGAGGGGGGGGGGGW